MKARLIAITCLARLGAFGEAAAEIEELRTVADASDDAILRWDFHLSASTVYGETNHEAAIEDARRALGFAVRVASKLRRYNEALDGHEWALAAYRDLGRGPSICEALLNIISVRMFCGDFERSRELFKEMLSDMLPYMALRNELLRGVLAKHTAHLEDAERHYLDARRVAREIGASYLCARSECELADLMMSQGRLHEARTWLDAALAAFAKMASPDVEVEALAFSARLLAMQGDAPAATELAARVMARCKEKHFQSYNEIAWNLASAFATMGDRETATSLAGEAIAAGIYEAMSMPADLAETFLKLPWHRDAFAYLWAAVHDDTVSCT